MGLGQRRHRLEIQRKPATPDLTAEGEDDRDFATIAYRYAEIRSLTSRELLQGQQLQADVSHEIRMRYYAIRPSDRLKWGSRYFNLIPATNPGERKNGTEIVVLAKEQV